MHNGIGRNGIGDDRASADHGILTNCDTRQNRYIGSNRTSAPEIRDFELLWPLLAPGKRVISKRGVRPDENIILDAQAIPKLHAAFYSDPVPDDDVVLDKNMVANIAILTNHRSRKNMGKSPDLGPCAHCVAFTNSLWMDEVIHVLQQV
jgi:hypothetical protein